MPRTVCSVVLFTVFLCVGVVPVVCHLLGHSLASRVRVYAACRYAHVRVARPVDSTAAQMELFV